MVLRSARKRRPRDCEQTRSSGSGEDVPARSRQRGPRIVLLRARAAAELRWPARVSLRPIDRRRGAANRSIALPCLRDDAAALGWLASPHIRSARRRHTQLPRSDHHALLRRKHSAGCGLRERRRPPGRSRAAPRIPRGSWAAPGQRSALDRHEAGVARGLQRRRIWGGLWFVRADGHRHRIPLEGVPSWAENVHGIVAQPAGPLVFVGLAHLSADYGAVLRCVRREGRWATRFVSRLDAAPGAAARLLTGDAVFVTTRGIGLGIWTCGIDNVENDEWVEGCFNTAMACARCPRRRRPGRGAGRWMPAGTPGAHRPGQSGVRRAPAHSRPGMTLCAFRW
jgi:hypothetical protein